MPAVTAFLTFALVLVVWGARLPPPRPIAQVGRADRAPSTMRRTVADPGPSLRVALVVGWTVTACLAIGPVPALLLVALSVLGRSSIRSTRRRSGAAAKARAMPELIDLFVVAASAGHAVASSLEQVAPRAPPAVRSEVLAAVARRRRGLPIDSVLAEMAGALGSSSGPLVDALRRSASSGAPLLPMLREAGAGARELRRSTAEAAARRLPVTMLLPLAACILPAAVLLAVVPVVLVSLASLR